MRLITLLLLLLAAGCGQAEHSEQSGDQVTGMFFLVGTPRETLDVAKGSGICEVHEVAMEARKVEITYGEPNFYHPRLSTSTKLTPHIPISLGGCVVHESLTHVNKWVCPKCEVNWNNAVEAATRATEKLR